MRKNLCSFTTTVRTAEGTLRRTCTKKAGHKNDHLVVSERVLPTTRSAADQCTECKRFMSHADLDAGLTAHPSCTTSPIAVIVEHVTPKETRMTRPTSTSARLDAVEAGIERIEAALSALVGSPATATAVATKPAAKKATAKRTTAKPAAKATKGLPLTQANRKAFVAAAPWAQGMSTKQIAEAVVSGQQECAPGFFVGPRYTEMFSA